MSNLPQGFSLIEDDQSLPQGFVIEDLPSEAPETMGLPELQDSGILAGDDPLKTAALTPALLTTTDPNEIAQIITTNYPNVGVQYNRAPDGNVYPILVNNETGAATVINRPGLSGLDVMQGLGIMSAFTPAGAAKTVGGAALKSALTSTAIEGAQESAGGEFDTEQVATDALLGGAFKYAEDAIGAGYRAVKGKPQSQTLQDIQEAGIPAMTSDVLPPQTFAGRMAVETGEKIPLAGTGGMRETQQIARTQAVEDIAEKYSQFSYDAIVKSLKDQKNRIKSAAGNVLEQSGNKLDEVGIIPIDNTAEAINLAKAELGKKGVIKTGGATDDLQMLIDAFEEAPQTFTTLKENRTAFRDIVKGFDKAERSQLGTRSKALLESVERAMAKDMRSFAKENLTPKEYQSWLKANAVYADEAAKLTKTRLKNVLDKGDMTPESVQTMLFSQKPSELRLLDKSLTPAGRANARGAIISKVVGDLSKRQAGFTPNSFATELKKYSPQVNILFKGQDKKQLQGLQRALEATRRAQDAGVTTPTGQQLLGGGTALSLFVDPVSTVGAGGTAGGLARLYESAPVRDVLLRLSSVPRGSTQFEQALSELNRILTASAQSAQRQQQGTE